MKKLLLLALLPFSVSAANLMICNGEYALCAASASNPTGKTIQVDGKEFQEGMAVCPVLTGKAVANSDLMKGSCKAPPGKVWSLFSTVTAYPQAPSWAVVTMTPRTFTTTTEAGGGMSNQWSFLCAKQVKKVNGVQLANCYGPINESPWNNGHVPPGTMSFTAAPVGAANPVGGNVPGK
jgi:hypothetical protein